jgi:FAD dependent oxidoreductase
MNRLRSAVENLLPACKNIGATHITNGCYRLHPVEWNIGEAAGSLLVQAGLELAWPRLHPVKTKVQQLSIQQSKVPMHFLRSAVAIERNKGQYARPGWYGLPAPRCALVQAHRSAPHA